MYAARATRQVSEWVMVQRRMLEDERDSEPKSDSKSHRDAKGSQEKSGRRITHVFGSCGTLSRSCVRNLPLRSISPRT